MSEKFIQLVRGKDTEELLLNNHNAFILLALIALRAKRTTNFNVHNLNIGEALIGDYKSCGLTEQKYRTAKINLEKWGFATFKPTNKGTIATIINTRIFDINTAQDNEQITSEQRTDNEQITNR